MTLVVGCMVQEADGGLETQYLLLTTVQDQERAIKQSEASLSTIRAFSLYGRGGGCMAGSSSLIILVIPYSMGSRSITVSRSVPEVSLT